MATPVAKIQAGEVSGSFNKRGDIAIFKGIPYAQSPVGPLRWRAPQPVTPWNGTLKTEKAGPAPIQLKAESSQEFFDRFLEGQGWGRIKIGAMKLMMRLAPTPKESEDCLTINVRTPSLDRAAKLPVMVWIYGGGHVVGSADDPSFSPDSNALARRGAVIVAFNYRLGLMGYFAHPELNQESEQGVAGNYGTLDQIAALRWVQENISAFGGDPDNVTIFGESAGGESVAHMMTSPLARGLFHRAIMQSASSPSVMSFLHYPFLTNPAGDELGQRFAKRLVPTGKGQVETLRQLSPERLYQFIRQEEYFSFNPVIDGFVLENSPFEAFLEGDQAPVPLLLGSNANEGTLLFPGWRSPVAGYLNIESHEVAGIVRERFGDLAEALFDLYPGLYQGEEKAQEDFLADNYVRANDHFYAEYAARAGQPVYRYLFTRTPPSPKQTLGAYHGSEIALVHGKFMPIFDYTEEDKALAQAMGDYWVQFARTGDPNLARHPQWAPYTAEDPQQMRLGTGADLGTIGLDSRARLEIMRQNQINLIEQMKQLQQSEPKTVPA
jgi:para-nitrobenzyl esterase